MPKQLRQKEIAEFMTITQWCWNRTV